VVYYLPKIFLEKIKTAAAIRGQSLVKTSDNGSVEQVFCTPSPLPRFDCDLGSRLIHRLDRCGGDSRPISGRVMVRQVNSKNQ
jgi:hypothetical protein